MVGSKVSLTMQLISPVSSACSSDSNMSSKRTCFQERCLRSSKFIGQHTHPQTWSDLLQVFLMKVAVLETCDNMCVCKACELNVRQSLKKRDNGNAFKLRWKKSCRV